MWGRSGGGEELSHAQVRVPSEVFFLKVCHHSLVLSLACLNRFRRGLVLCPLMFAHLLGRMS